MQANLQRDVGVVIPAGGRGERVGGPVPKQFRDIAGVPMLLRSIRPFMATPYVSEIVIPLPTDIYQEPPVWLRELTGDALKLVEGGDSRAASVANGVAALSDRCSVVLVHDAARPFVETETIERVVDAVRTGVSAVAAVPATDTLKRVDAEGRILETLDRSTVWRAQTPQGFPRQVLRRVYDAHPDGFDAEVVTDEASLVEAAGMPVVIVRDAEWNLKVTSARDFELAEVLTSR